MADNDERNRSSSSAPAPGQVQSSARTFSQSPTGSRSYQPRVMPHSQRSAISPFQTSVTQDGVYRQDVSPEARPDSPVDERTRLLTREQGHHHRSQDRMSINESLLAGTGLRYRHHLRDTPNPSPGRSGVNVRSPHRSVAVGTNIGTVLEDPSRKFSLAGPQVAETTIANQSYIDPGYSQLNPAYDQPANARPVWSLAKPLPRVLRPGMVPTTSELEGEVLHYRNRNEDPEHQGIDDEQDRIEPTLRYDKIAPQLDHIREQREIQLCESYGVLESVRSPSLRPVLHQGGFASPRQHQEARIPEEQEEPLEEQLPQLSKAIEHVREAKLLEPPYEDAIPLKAYEAGQDEVHNLHTYWSVIRLQFREPLAELLAVTVQLTLGFSASLVITISGGRAGGGRSVEWSWGLATMIAIYIAGGISGAHLNPAVSITLWIYRGFPLGKVPSYIFAQILGAFLATFIAFSIYRPGIIALSGPDLARSETLGDFITFPRDEWVNSSSAFLTEFVGTAILAICVLALGDDTNAPPGAGMNAFIIGLVITVLSMSLGWNTGLAMNPARDFGPRVALVILGYGTNLFADRYWFTVVWLGPITGAIFGGLLYDMAIFVGGESPVNYPSVRVKRAINKWVERSRIRFRRTKKTLKDLK